MESEKKTGRNAKILSIISLAKIVGRIKDQTMEQRSEVFSIFPRFSRIGADMKQISHGATNKSHIMQHHSEKE